MSKLQIKVEGFDSPAEAEEALVKALTQHARGESHKSDFQDPAARDVVKKITIKHEKMFDKMVREIIKVVEEDFRDGNI